MSLGAAWTGAGPRVMPPIICLALFGAALATAQAPQRPGMSYTEESPPSRARLELRHLQGQARDRAGMAIPGVALGLYTDAAPHRLLALALADADGKFDFGKRLAPGDYRLIAQYPGLCTANIPVRVSPRAPGRKLALRMEFPGLDVCSYAQLK
ncbi:MAG: hypothetical protein ACRD1E_11820 [Terriglobales bacterium]